MGAYGDGWMEYWTFYNGRPHQRQAEASSSEHKYVCGKHLPLYNQDPSKSENTSKTLTQPFKQGLRRAVTGSLCCEFSTAVSNGCHTWLGTVAYCESYINKNTNMEAIIALSNVSFMSCTVLELCASCLFFLSILYTHTTTGFGFAR